MTNLDHERAEEAADIVTDRSGLADFLRIRRAALQPEDVGLPRGPRRRTHGLRREEIAALAGMSPDYYARIERGAGPNPSDQMIAALARALRLSLVERDHLFLLAGHTAPPSLLRSDHVSTGLMRVLDRLPDTPAQIMSGLGETLAQTPPARALLGDQTRFTGEARSLYYRWFMTPSCRDVYVREDHPKHSRTFVAQLRAVASRQGPRSPAVELAERLRRSSSEFATLWSDHEIGLSYLEEKRFLHAEVGRLDLFCQTLLDPERDQALLVFTATPGSASYDKLQLLAVVGDQDLTSA
jgi:transcriptional regulator with XRE-family HTH domain